MAEPPRRGRPTNPRRAGATGGSGRGTTGRGSGGQAGAGGRGDAGRAGAGRAGAARGGTDQSGTGAARRGTSQSGTARGGDGGSSGRRVGRAPAAAGSAAGARRGRSAATELGLGGEQVEGRQAVRELLAAGRRRVRTVWIATSAEETATLQDIVTLAAEAQVTVNRVERFRLDQMALTEAPQGVVAWADPVAVVELETLIRSTPGGAAPFLLVIDGVTDPHNVGALLRSAACAGATGAVIPKHRAAHLTPSAVKAAAGAVEHLPISLVSGIPSALKVLADAGLWTVGLEVGAADRLWDLPVAGAPIALVVGAEGKGLAKLVRDRCELLVSIPQSGVLDSLNVSAAGALALFEVARRRS